MKLKPLALLAFSLFAAQYINAQTYVAMVKPDGSKEWGYVNLDGEYAIEPQYRRCIPFSENGLALVQNPKNKEYQFINLSGETLNTEVTDFKPKSSFGFGVIGFTNGMAPITKDKKWGYLDQAGKLKIPLKYDAVSPFDNGYAVVRLGETFMVIDREGKEVTPPAPVYKIKDMKSGMAPFYTTEKKEGFVNSKGEIAIEAKFDGVGYFHGDLAWARTSDGNVGYINKTGQWVIKPQFEAVKDFPAGEKLARVKKDGVWTYVNRSGEIVKLPLDQISDFSEGLAYGRKGDLVGFYDTNGAWVIQPQYEAVRDFKNGYAAARKGDLWGVIDKTGEWVIQPKFDEIRDMEKVK